MKFVLASIVLLLARVAAAQMWPQPDVIKHLQLDDAQMIWTSDNNYAITHPSLLEREWKSVTVDGDEITIMKPNCDEIKKSMATLPADEKALLSAAKRELENIDQANLVKNLGPNVRYCSTIWYLEREAFTIRRCKNMEVSSTEHEEILIQKHNEHQFSVALPHEEDKFSRVFFNKEVMTFVFKLGTVRMFPQGCLDFMDKVVVDEVTDIYAQAEADGKVRVEEVLVVRDESRPLLECCQFGKVILEKVQSVFRLAEIKIKQMIPGRAN